jgi:hypothetical protein
MADLTQPKLAEVEKQTPDQYLIVPIFFKQQIEAIIASSSPAYAFGFFYGDEIENYRIIKKIWPLRLANRDGSQIKISKQDFLQASLLTRGTSLKLLGCFFTSENGGVTKALLSDGHPATFSFIKLNGIGEGEKCTWTGSICKKGSDKLFVQKVIL